MYFTYLIFVFHLYFLYCILYQHIFIYLFIFFFTSNSHLYLVFAFSVFHRLGFSHCVTLAFNFPSLHCGGRRIGRWGRVAEWVCGCVGGKDSGWVGGWEGGRKKERKAGRSAWMGSGLILARDILL